MRDLLTASSWFRDEAQRRRTQEVLRERIADDREQEECRYLMRFAWQLSMSYREVSYEELAAHVRPEKLARVDALLAAAQQGYEAIDEWLARCEAELSLI